MIIKTKTIINRNNIILYIKLNKILFKTYLNKLLFD